MTKKQLQQFLNLLMVSDPWPLDDDGVSQEILQEYANAESEKFGFSSWFQAYHELSDIEIDETSSVSQELEESLVFVEDCEARGARLSEWERKFVESVREQLEKGRSLSEKQVVKLEEIWEKATEKG